MRLPALALALTLLPLTTTSCRMHEDERSNVARAYGRSRTERVDIQDAIARAVAARPGSVVEAELETTDDARIVYEIAIVTEAGLFEISLDPATGAVLSNIQDEGDDTESELAGYRAALRAADVTLEAMIAEARELVNGHVVQAELENEDDEDDEGVLGEITLVHDTYAIEVEVDAVTGRVVEIELDADAEDDEEADERGGDDAEGDDAEEAADAGGS